MFGRIGLVVIAASACTPQQQDGVYNDLFVDLDIVLTVESVSPGQSGSGRIDDRCPEGSMPGCETQSWTVTLVEYDEHAGSVFPHLTSAGPSGGNTFAFSAGLTAGSVPITVHASGQCGDDADDACERQVSGSVTINDVDPTPHPDAQNTTAIDTCMNAAAGEVGTQTGDTTSYLDDATPPGSCTNGFSAFGPDAFYRFELTDGQTLTATVTPEGWDAMLYILRGCEPMFCSAGVDNAGSGAPETTTFTAVGGGTYYVVVDSPSLANKGAFTLNVDVQ
ncbi:MAG TPA: PPC domain-containing protein [Kofleriaceae bacterium]|nr:PPC domain-containing protein [Kofleriaceae bacterium]